MFDEAALDELAFVSRAKGIGMSLDDIAGLVAAWPTGECRSLQARLRGFLAGWIARVRAQQAELATFERQLQGVLADPVLGGNAACEPAATAGRHHPPPGSQRRRHRLP